MFKKKGGLAFKPKVPSARSRPVARPVQSTPPAEAEPSIDKAVDTPPDDAINGIIDQSTGQETTAPSIEATTKPSVPDISTSSSSAPEPTNIITSEPLLSQPKPTRSGLRKPAETSAGQASDSDAIEASTAVIVSVETPSATAAPTSRNEEGTIKPTSTATPVSDDASTPAPTVPPRVTRTTAAAPPTEDGVEDGETRPRKRQRKTVTQGGEQAPKPRQRRRRTQEPQDEGQAARRGRARSLTPEDAESQTVDLQKLKMADLTKDLHIGKKFSRHDELRERERQKRIKAKLEKNGEGGDAAGDGPDSLRAKEQSATPSAPPVEAPAPAPAGPQFRIVDGQIVVDQNSLAVDRHARAAAARAGEDMETIEENDFTRLITSNSFMNTSKLKGPNVWTEEETVLFYRGLAMFGTDFEIISKMIPGKQRRHVKLKFNREERHCPRRVNAALVGEKTVAMDMDEYRAATGAEFEPVEVIEAEQKKIEDGYEAERQRIADEQAEVMRKKKEELFADEDIDMAGVVGKKKKKKGKKRVEYELNEEPLAEEGV